MTKKQNIIYFTKEILGCGCSDEVFEIIEEEDNVTLDDGMNLFKKLKIGNKLLIYIIFNKEIEPNPLKENDLEKILNSIFQIGKKERDELGFNRFRLVIGSTVVSGQVLKIGGEFKVSSKYDQIFSKLKNLDDKMHIHVVPKRIIEMTFK